jgi:O-acetyl-ADP-ribose deacetylase (regulator of RNase III)
MQQVKRKEDFTMITYVAGDLFMSPAKVLVNTVNTEGVMGKGIALHFKKIFPDMFRMYQEYCEAGDIQIGKLWIYKTPHKWVLNFPTKKAWRQPSKVEYIEAGLRKLTERFGHLGIHSIAFPALGCGNGELDWEEVVRPLMETYLNKLPADVFVHPPLSVALQPEHRNQNQIKSWLRSEPETLSFSEVLADLNDVLARKSEFTTIRGNTFRASLETKELPGLKINVNERNYVVSNEQLLELWQQLRRHGYLRRGVIPDELDKVFSYIMPILVELNYIESVTLSESGDFSERLIRPGTFTGLQYAPYESSSQRGLFVSI